jgi:phosphopantetheinyl transferase (holo-ACP synthase)
MGRTVGFAGTAFMDGKVTFKAEDFAAYLGKMLGRGVALDAAVQLTSGQQARAAGWLAERGLADEDLRTRLSIPFSPATFVHARDAVPQQSAKQPVQSSTVDLDAESLRIGVDIQSVDELFPERLDSDLKSSSELTSLFTFREISYAQSRPNPLDTLSGLFAAKEALRKCDTALLTLPLKELEILPNAAGRPEFRGFALSISHSGGFAIAVAAKLSVPLLSSKGLPVAGFSQDSVASHSAPPSVESKVTRKWFVVTLLIAVAVLVCGSVLLKLIDVFSLHH